MYSFGYKLSVCGTTGLVLLLAETIHRVFAIRKTLTKKVCLSVNVKNLLDLDAFGDLEMQLPSVIGHAK